MLLDHGADPNAVDNAGKRPVEPAYGKSTACKALYDEAFSTPFYCSCTLL